MGAALVALGVWTLWPLASAPISETVDAGETRTAQVASCSPDAPAGHLCALPGLKADVATKAQAPVEGLTETREHARADIDEETHVRSQRRRGALCWKMGEMNEPLSTLAVAVSVLVVGGYEVQEVWAARHDPVATARSAHRLMRGDWVRALSKQPGSEIIAVQALRNSVMSATIMGSTAVLVLMGVVSLVAASGSAPLTLRELTLRAILEFLLVLTLFSTYVCAAMAMRYYHHAGFIISMPVGSPERTPFEPIAGSYVQRAGVLYSWSLRCFLYAGPMAMGLVNALAMPFAALALVAVLAFFDRAPRRMDD